MKAVALSTIFSLLLVSLHVSVAHPPVDAVHEDSGHSHGHVHSHASRHSHSHGTCPDSTTDADSSNKAPSHDPSDHKHDEALRRCLDGDSASSVLKLACIGPINGCFIPHTTLVASGLFCDADPPPPGGKLFLSNQSLLI